MTVHLTITTEETAAILRATLDTTTRRVTALEVEPHVIPTLFIALNALLGTLEGHLHLQHLNTSHA
jgi:hypothetical protein